MENCIFCKIANKEIPAEVVYENDDFVSFMDINPQAPGHVQVIPKKHVRYVWDVENFAEYFLLVKKIARAIQGTFGTDTVWMKVMGEEVPHAHVWLFPMAYEATGDKKDFAGNAEKIRQNLAL
ncbi:MAG: HIT domain-containing protein [Parcubacteria group bacterium]|nr:HIT domain-containing protein [Parcubacteria group bacterium]